VIETQVGIVEPADSAECELCSSPAVIYAVDSEHGPRYGCHDHVASIVLIALTVRRVVAPVLSPGDPGDPARVVKRRVVDE
jgi:hypothetical protein